MKNLSLQKLYILSALKSSLINLIILICVSFIGIEVLNNQQLHSLTDQLILTNQELEQVEQFKLTKNKDSLDLYLIERKESKSLDKIQITDRTDISNCQTHNNYFICGSSPVEVFQKLPLSENSYIQISHAGLQSPYGPILYLLSFVIFLFNILTSYFSNRFAQKEIRKQISSIENGNTAANKIHEFEKLEKIINNANKTIIDETIAKSNIKIIKKLQHDIDSPMTSIEFFFNEARQYLKEDLRQLGRQSLNRISDIINTLKVNEANSILEENSSKEIVAIYPILKRIVSEKRNEYKNRMDVQIDLEPSSDKDAFISIKKSDFYRTISNIINNSVEAKKENNDICIKVSSHSIDGNIEVVISDNGKGISEDHLDEIFEYGMTIDKETGSGIGLYQSKEYIESEGGKIEINSCQRQGTILKISLNEAEAPKWYAKEVNLESHNIVVVDDDDSIHKLWKEKLSALNFKTIHFKSSEEFEGWAKDNDIEQYNYLFDLDLIGSKLNGLELISAYKLQSKSLLVTSHFMDSTVQEKCNALNTKMIPKESVVNIKVLKEIKDRPKEIVLIDDDRFTHMNWKRAARNENIDLHSFETIEAFLDNKDNFQIHTPIYIDSNLGNGIKGEIESEKIFDQGFEELFLATGMSKEDIEVPYWIKGIYGKTFRI